MNLQSAASFPRELAVDIRLDDSPRYKGSIHDDAVARARGYRAALVPGAFVYGHVSRIAIEAWGEAWAQIGCMGARFRRPVFNGDRLVLRAGPLEAEDNKIKSEVSVENQDGENVAAGWIGIPNSAPAPLDVTMFSLLPRPQEPPAVSPGGIVVGMPLTTAGNILSEAAFRESLSAFGEHHPLYSDRRFVHSGCLMRVAMGDTNNSFKSPSPIILVSAEAQHFATVRPGQRLETAGQVTAAYERNGKHYFDSEEFLLADGTLSARFNRTSIYAYG